MNLRAKQWTSGDKRISFYSGQRLPNLYFHFLQWLSATGLHMGVQQVDQKMWLVFNYWLKKLFIEVKGFLNQSVVYFSGPTN